MPPGTLPWSETTRSGRPASHVTETVTAPGVEKLNVRWLEVVSGLPDTGTPPATTWYWPGSMLVSRCRTSGLADSTVYVRFWTGDDVLANKTTRSLASVPQAVPPSISRAGTIAVGPSVVTERTCRNVSAVDSAAGWTSTRQAPASTSKTDSG